MVFLQKEFDGFTLTLTIACEIGTTPTEENTTEEWNVWQEQYRENPTGQIVALRLKVRNGNTPTLSIQYDILRETMDKIVAADTISIGSYLINVEGLSTPVLLHMDCDRVVAIEAYGHYVELASALRACGNGNYDFSFFEADGAIVLEGGFYNIDTIYILAPEASSVILPGEAASYCLWLDEEGKLKYRYTHNEIASIIQCGALSVATAYDEFLYAVGDAKIVNGEVVFSDQSESYVMSDKYD